jgi:hypothetical protein
MQAVHDAHDAGVRRHDIGKEGETGFAATAPKDEIALARAGPIQANQGAAKGAIVAIDGLHHKHSLTGKIGVFDGGMQVADDAAKIHVYFLEGRDVPTEIERAGS